jgi:hypothetical protein
MTHLSVARATISATTIHHDQRRDAGGPRRRPGGGVDGHRSHGSAFTGPFKRIFRRRSVGWRLRSQRRGRRFKSDHPPPAAGLSRPAVAFPWEGLRSRSVVGNAAATQNGGPSRGRAQDTRRAGLSVVRQGPPCTDICMDTTRLHCARADRPALRRSRGPLRQVAAHGGGVPVADPSRVASGYLIVWSVASVPR